MQGELGLPGLGVQQQGPIQSGEGGACPLTAGKE